MTSSKSPTAARITNKSSSGEAMRALVGASARMRRGTKACKSASDVKPLIDAARFKDCDVSLGAWDVDCNDEGCLNVRLRGELRDDTSLNCMRG